MDHGNVITFMQKHVKNFKVNRRSHLVIFTCPNPDCNSPETAQFVPGTSKVNCHKCKYVGDIVDISQMLGVATTTDTEKIKDQLCIEFGVENTRIKKEILDFYKASGFDLTPLKKKSKLPFEQSWPDNKHKEVYEWDKWLTLGMNIGVKTGTRSNITIIDVDQAEIPADIDLLKGNTLIQKTGRGWHLIYKFTSELPTSKIAEYKIDILNDGKQAVLFPSVILDEKTNIESSREFITPLVINEMPAELLRLLKSKLDPATIEKSSNAPLIVPENYKVDLLALKNNNLEGCCDDTFTQLGGLLVNQLSITDTAYVLRVLNKHLLDQPMDQQRIGTICKSVEKFAKSDSRKMIEAIFKYLNVVEFANSKEIKDALGFPKEEIDKCLAHLVKELKLIKRGRNFSIVKRADWKTSLNMTAKNLDFEMPYFHEHAGLCYGDNVLLASCTKNGKTTIAMNIIKRISDQLKAKSSNRKIYYMGSEAGSRFMSTAMTVGLAEGDFEWDFVCDPTKINLENDAITILDWLMIENKAESDIVMKYFSEQLNKTNGFLITFMQLKEGSNEWFAPNMVKQYPSLAARYIYLDDTGLKGKWVLDAIREPKKHNKTGIIPCTYDWKTKLLTAD